MFRLGFLTLPTLILIEMLNRHSLHKKWVNWLLHHPDLFLFNFLLVFSVYAFFKGLLGNVRRAALSGFVVLMAFSLIDTTKFSYLQQRLNAHDFLLAKEVIYLLPTMKGIFWVIVGIFAVVCLGFVYTVRARHPAAQPAGSSGPRTCLLVFPALFLLITSNILPFSPMEHYLNHNSKRWDLQANYERLGFLLGFLDTAGMASHIKKPENYTEKTMKAWMSATPDVPPAVGEPALAKPPNLIMIMSEAFFNPLQLPLTFSTDPLPTIRHLWQSQGEPSLITPSFGGATSNVEFEVLTGLSVDFLPSGSFPYHSFIHQPLPSLAQFLKEKGYTTVAIHPYHKNFYNRENVYPLLGFDTFISLENWGEAETVDRFVTDNEVTQKIIQLTQAFKEPYFIFAITIQNHLPFRTPPDEDLTVQGESLSQESKKTLESYLAGVRDADESLHALITHLEKQPAPVLLAFWGDHWPALQSVYETLSTREADHRVPLVLWANFKKIPPVASLNAFYLSALALKHMGLALSLPFSFLDKLQAVYPTLQGGFSHAVNDPLIEEYGLMEYDLLFGKKYTSRTSRCEPLDPGSRRCRAEAGVTRGVRTFPTTPVTPAEERSDESRGPVNISKAYE